MKLKVLQPDVNESAIDFTVVDNKIRFGLKAVKNVGESPSAAIVSSRLKDGHYEKLSDLASRLEPRVLNRRTIESLIAAGACDSLEGSRAQKSEIVEAVLEFGHTVYTQSGTNDLFAGSGVTVERVAPALPDIKEWSKAEKLGREKAMLGFYISGHPLDKYRTTLGSFSTSTTAGIGSVADGREVTVGGIISAIKTMTDKKGNLMAFVTIEDFSGTLELILFSRCYEKCKEFVEVDRMVLVTGKVSTREGEAPKVMVAEVLPLEKLTERFDCQLVIKLGADCSDDQLKGTLETLESYRGKVPVLLAARENGTEVFIRSKKYSVNLDFQLLDRLKELLGDSEAYLRPIRQ